LELYKVKMKYIRNLMNVDKTNNIQSISSQRHKHNRVFVGIIVMVDSHEYCIPLSTVSSKDKYENMRENITMRKIKNDKNEVIGILNINNMIPIRKEYLIPYDIDISADDSKKQKEYKLLCQSELKWCNDNCNEITRLAQELHRIITNNLAFSKRRICPDYKVLERECDKAKKIK